MKFFLVLNHFSAALYIPVYIEEAKPTTCFSILFVKLFWGKIERNFNHASDNIIYGLHGMKSLRGVNNCYTKLKL